MERENFFQFQFISNFLAFFFKEENKQVVGNVIIKNYEGNALSGGDFLALIDVNFG